MAQPPQLPLSDHGSNSLNVGHSVLIIYYMPSPVYIDIGQDAIGLLCYKFGLGY